MSSQPPYPPPPPGPPQQPQQQQGYPPPQGMAYPPPPPGWPTPPPPRGGGSAWKAPLMILVGSAVGVLLGFGACGVGATASGGSQGTFVTLGLALLALSALGFFVGVIWMLVALITGNNR